MKQQIDDVKKCGFKPILFVDSDLVRSGNEDLRLTIEGAKELGVPVLHSEDVGLLNKMHKAYVFRYGYLSPYTETMVKKKNGIVASGDLKVPCLA